VIHVRADGVGHFLHDESPSIMVDAIRIVVQAVRGDGRLPACEAAFDESFVTCLT
jgi:hypothetical protein